ncbi:hypothetical protein [Paenibacillus apii]|uniref:hypothetical protein n=1 Tax=Paenibacillus apii TaxID=1850370 RepID=UPI001F4282AD|nr:hypothetical protein [Paenibacillus apii]
MDAGAGEAAPAVLAAADGAAAWSPGGCEAPGACGRAVPAGPAVLGPAADAVAAAAVPGAGLAPGVPLAASGEAEAGAAPPPAALGGGDTAASSVPGAQPGSSSAAASRRGARERAPAVRMNFKMGTPPSKGKERGQQSAPVHCIKAYMIPFGMGRAEFLPLIHPYKGRRQDQMGKSPSKSGGLAQNKGKPAD